MFIFFVLIDVRKIIDLFHSIIFLIWSKSGERMHQSDNSSFNTVLCVCGGGGVQIINETKITLM